MDLPSLLELKYILKVYGMFCQKVFKYFFNKVCQFPTYCKISITKPLLSRTTRSEVRITKPFQNVYFTSIDFLLLIIGKPEKKKKTTNILVSNSLNLAVRSSEKKS